MFGDIPYVVVIGTLGLVQAVSVAVIGGFFSKESKKRKADQTKMDERAKLRAEESHLAMQLMSANASLASATGLALKEGRTNGKMDEALMAAQRAQQEYYAFINRVASTQMTAD